MKSQGAKCLHRFKSELTCFALLGSRYNSINVVQLWRAMIPWCSSLVDLYIKLWLRLASQPARAACWLPVCCCGEGHCKSSMLQCPSSSGCWHGGQDGWGFTLVGVSPVTDSDKFPTKGQGWVQEQGKGRGGCDVMKQGRGVGAGLGVGRSVLGNGQ